MLDECEMITLCLSQLCPFLHETLNIYLSNNGKAQVHYEPAAIAVKLIGVQAYSCLYRSLRARTLPTLNYYRQVTSKLIIHLILLWLFHGRGLCPYMFLLSLHSFLHGLLTAYSESKRCNGCLDISIGFQNNSFGV
jgi:hypothetical protein